MSKKIKILILIILILIFAWLIIFAVDYNRCSNMKEPVFVITKQENDLTLKSITYQGLGYKVEVEKTVSEKCSPEITKVEMYIFDKFITGAIAEIDNQEEIIEDVVKIINGKIENENLIDEFMNETANKQDKTLKIEIIEDGISKNVEVSFIANSGQQLDLSDNTQKTEIRIWLL